MSDFFEDETEDEAITDDSHSDYQLLSPQKCALEN